MIGDFTHFFDMLDHGYLKRQWCSLFHTDRLSADHYAIFKNITQYSYIELSNLLAFHGLKNTSKGRRELNCKKRALSPKELKENTSWIQKNKGCGIPQGSPISGALANVYMLEADKEIHTFVSEHEGLYMRYSDDFIIILPHISETDAIDAFKQIRTILAQHPGLNLQPSKTQYYYFHEKQIQNCREKIDRNASTENHQLNFLGFTFDGRTVRLRAKTVSKFYQRMRRSAKRITKGDGHTKNGNRISGKNLYKKYSVRGAGIKKREEKEEKKPGGNFLTYVYRAQEENRFGPCKDIAVITDRNMAKIRGFLKKG